LTSCSQSGPAGVTFASVGAIGLMKGILRNIAHDVGSFTELGKCGIDLHLLHKRSIC